jgi:protein-S-isoprenylcysteine O-methyltransferase Ste14
MAPREDTAGVIFPPPLIYAGGFLLGLALGWGLALQRLPLPPTLNVLGGLLLLLSVLLWFSAIRNLRRARTQVNPFKPTTALVTAGAFQRSRNPIYVAMTLLYLGLALLLGALGPLLLLLPVLAVIRFGVVAREERYLNGKFGEAYATYSRQVGRWL